MSQLQKGRLKWFKIEKGFGFIEVEQGKDIFVHASQLEEHIEPGEAVAFEVKPSKKGPVAIRVKKAS